MDAKHFDRRRSNHMLFSYAGESLFVLPLDSAQVWTQPACRFKAARHGQVLAYACAAVLLALRLMCFPGIGFCAALLQVRRTRNRARRWTIDAQQQDAALQIWQLPGLESSAKEVLDFIHRLQMQMPEYLIGPDDLLRSVYSKPRN